MKRLVLGALALLATSAASPPDAEYVPPFSDPPWVNVQKATPGGGSFDYRFGCHPLSCRLKGTGEWTITTASGTFVVHGGFSAESAAR